MNQEVPIHKSVCRGALGDVNNDGFINIRDVCCIKRYLAGYSDVHINIKAANVNRDYDNEQKDLISIADAVIILRHLAGFDTIKVRRGSSRMIKWDKQF